MRVGRERRGWSQQDMANRLAEMGEPIDRATLARTESGARGLALDDALLYAAALDASPVGLLFPEDDEAPVALGPKFRVRSAYARRWLMGLAPLPVFIAHESPGTLSDEELLATVKTADGKVLTREEADERTRLHEALPAARCAVAGRDGGCLRPGRGQ
jgi:transcriptional regulator with XRE-family HTH domain